MTLLLLLKGSAFLLVELELSLCCVSIRYLQPPQSGLPALLATGLATCHHCSGMLMHSRPFTAPLAPTAVLLYLAECGFLPPPTQAGETVTVMVTVAQGEISWPVTGGDGVKVMPATLLCVCTSRLLNSMELHEWLRNWGLSPYNTMDRFKTQPLDQTELNQMMIRFCVFMY